jgi:hypothetical protein
VFTGGMLKEATGGAEVSPATGLGVWTNGAGVSGAGTLARSFASMASRKMSRAFFSDSLVNACACSAAGHHTSANIIKTKFRHFISLWQILLFGKLTQVLVFNLFPEMSTIVYGNWTLEIDKQFKKSTVPPPPDMHRAVRRPTNRSLLIITAVWGIT